MKITWKVAKRFESDTFTTYVSDSQLAEWKSRSEESIVREAVLSDFKANVWPRIVASGIDREPPEPQIGDEVQFIKGGSVRYSGTLVGKIYEGEEVSQKVHIHSPGTRINPHRASRELAIVKISTGSVLTPPLDHVKKR